MKLVLLERSAVTVYGVLTTDGVVVLDGLLEGDSPQEQLEWLIDGFGSLRGRIEQLSRERQSVPLESVRLLAPVPWPGKILVSTAAVGGGEQPLLFTLKSAESVIGPGETVKLPRVDSSWEFVPRASLGLVIRGPAKNVAASQWQQAVFGYTCTIDVMARGDQQFGRDYWLAKADTLGPLGPCIVTADEIPDPSAIDLRSWQNGEVAQDFRVADVNYSIGQQVELATTVMTLCTGDVLTCGTAAQEQRPLRDGDGVDVEIEHVGRLSVRVSG